MNVKEEMSSREEFISEDIRPTHTPYTLVETEMKIKHEEVDFHNNTSTRANDSEADSDLDLETMFRIQRVDSNPVKIEEKYLKDFYLDLLQCDGDCETCVRYIRLLSEHVRSSHSPPQPTQDPLLIDPLHIDLHYCLTDQSSSSIHIKSEVDEDIVKVGCSEEEEEKDSDESDPDCNIESDIEGDPDYGPSPSMTHDQGSTENITSSQPKSSKAKMGLVPSLGQFKCEECGISFKHLTTLKAHKRIHTGEKPHHCVYCERGFKDKDTLVEHEKVHTGERPYMCEVCGKGFSVKRDLNRHDGIHTGVKPYSCPVCEKCFLNSGQLNRHKRIHTEEKPYKCKECEKSFRNSSDLRRHERRIHTRPFKYEKSYSTPSHIKVYKRKH